MPINMYCCPDCFTHSFLQEIIRKSPFSKKGVCSYCSNKKNHTVCTPSILNDYFQPILDLYTKSKAGVLLNEQLQKDWQIFNNSLQKKQQPKLLSQIALDKTISTQKVVSRLSPNSTIIDKWEKFREELQHENRFFPKKAIMRNQLEELISYLKMETSEKPTYVYRARVNRTLKQYEISEMGKPPKEKTMDGRANPKGIPYFYGASDEKTSIAETRPYKSENVCVAKFRLMKKAVLVDLREPKKTIAPFGLDDDSLMLLYKEHMPFLGHLGTALSIPVLPHKKDLDYLPTQYLCELIKDQNFDGIAFKSSLAKGDNYVIFNDSLLKGAKVDTYSIKDTIIEPEKVKL